jgi:hypothetical protein
MGRCRRRGVGHKMNEYNILHGRLAKGEKMVVVKS